MLRYVLAAAFAASAASIAAPSVEPATAKPPPVPATAAEAGAQIQRARNQAQQALKPGASPEQLRRGAAELERLRALLDQQPYRDFAGASNHVYSERLNIGAALAEMRARLGDREGALQALESTTGVALIPAIATAFEHDQHLASIKDEPRFKAVLAQHRRGAIVSGKGFASPYAETLTREQRIAGLSLFWSEVRHNFANVDLMPQVDWDGVYLDYLAKVDKADTTAAYYAVLMQLAPLLHDGHTNIYPPQQLVSHFYARPPIDTALVEDAVVVTSVHDPDLKERIRPGDRILAIDGIPVKTYAEQRVRPLVSSSTEQDRAVRMYGYQLLHGDANVPVALTLANGQRRETTLSLPRSGRRGDAGQRFPFKVLPSGVAYLRIDDFESDGGIKAFEAAWPEIRKARGLVLDVRTNGGGSTNFGTRILARLSNKPIEGTIGRVRFENQSMRAQAGDMVAWQPLPDRRPAPALPADQVYAGPVALLIGARTFSAAEDFGAMFAQAKRGALVGEATGGSTGQPLMLDLPGGGKARICVKRDTYSDGSDFVGRGIRPTLEVHNTIAAVREGKDPVLDAAETLLLAHPESYALAP